LKGKYSKKEQVIQQDIKLIAERIASLTTSATSLEEFEPPLKGSTTHFGISLTMLQRRKIIRTEDVLDAKRLQMRKELDDIDADIERVSTVVNGLD
jgi:hypothetical protein